MSKQANNKKILILFAHPAQHHSKANSAMVKVAKQLNDVTFIDLYSDYPRFKIDVEVEQQRLLDHDIIIFQFPIFWYSTPAIIKEWQDLVLEYGFAYGHDGDKLTGKKFMIAATAGRDVESYSTKGANKVSLRTLLRPLELTAELCNMQFIPPFILHSSLTAQQNDNISNHANEYGKLLTALSEDKLDFDKAAKREFLNNASLPLKGAKS